MMDNLTERQKQIMGLAADGMYNKDIAEELGVAEGNIGTQIDRIKKKLNIPSKLKAALIYQEESLHEQRSKRLWAL